MLFGGASLSYPFGHDQGVHWYVAHEWLKRGAMPYRDTFDYKTPGIFLVHLVAATLGGDGQRPIRVAELGCVLALGVLVGKIGADPRERVPGLTGLAVLATSIFYFGYFSFWDTAQCEIWAALFAFGSLAAAMRIERGSLAAGVAGLCGGLAILMKPPVALLLGTALWWLHRRRERSLVWLVFAAGLLLPWIVVGSVFAAKGAGRDLWDVLVFANLHYVVDARRVSTFGAWFDESVNVFVTFNPFSSVLAVLLVLRARSGTFLRDYGSELALFAAAYVGILLQLKFYRYHFGVLAPIFALVVVRLAREHVLRAEKTKRAVAWSAVAIVGAYFLSGIPARDWRYSTAAAFELWSGRSTREQFAARFSAPALIYSQADSEKVAAWLRAHAAPGDEVAVRGFEPEIYQLSGMRYAGRFFWTVPLVDPHRMYEREAWLAQDERAFAEHAPRFVVALADLHRGPEAPETFEARGYSRKATIGRLVILEAHRE